MKKYYHIICMIQCTNVPEYPKLQLRLDISKLDKSSDLDWKHFLSAAQIARIVKWSPVEFDVLCLSVEPFYSGDILYEIYRPKLNCIFNVYESQTDTESK